MMRYFSLFKLYYQYRYQIGRKKLHFLYFHFPCHTWLLRQLERDVRFTKFSIVRFNPLEFTIRNKAWSGTPRAPPPGFQPYVNQQFPFDSIHDDHCYHSSQCATGPGGQRYRLPGYYHTNILNLALPSVL